MLLIARQEGREGVPLPAPPIGLATGACSALGAFPLPTGTGVCGAKATSQPGATAPPSRPHSHSQMRALLPPAEPVQAPTLGLQPRAAEERLRAGVLGEGWAECG